MRVSLVGVLDEQGGSERRVALVPATVARLAATGLSVIIEAGAGGGAGYTDRAYTDAGATSASRERVLEQADVVVFVSAPTDDDVAALRAGQVVVGLLSPRDRPALVGALGGRGVVAVDLGKVPRTLSRAQALDVLTSQASVVGYKAAVVAADAYGRFFPMMITAAGTSRPANVLVLGAGVAGLSAMGTVRRLGAVVTGYDVRPQTRTEVESMGAKWLDLAAGSEVGAAPAAAGEGGYARVLTDDERAAQQHLLEERVAAFDVVITTAAVPGARPPQLLSLAAVGRMRAGSVIIDTAAGPFGGNVEGSVEGATVTTENGVVVIGASDLASRAATAASDAFSSNIAALLSVLVVDGELADVAGDDEVLRAMVTLPPGARVVPLSKEGPNEPLTAV